MFGDYLGIGAGAHSKISQTDHILRQRKQRQPTLYLNPDKPFIAEEHTVPHERLAFEFMLNALRLYQKIPFALLRERTGFLRSKIDATLQIAQEKGLLNVDEEGFSTTAQGKRYLNDLLALFLSKD